MVCRLCLKAVPSESVVKLYYDTNSTIVSLEIVKLIEKYLDIEVRQDDEVSTMICKDCNDHLDEFHRFRQNVAEKQFTLRIELLEARLKAENQFDGSLDVSHDYKRKAASDKISKDSREIEQAEFEFSIDIVKNEFLDEIEGQVTAPVVLESTGTSKEVIIVRDADEDFFPVDIQSSEDPKDNRRLHLLADPLERRSSTMQLNRIDYSPSSDTVGNFNSKEELRRLLGKTHRVIFENFKVNRKLTNIERVKISKTIIQHLLTNPTRILSTMELLNISEMIAQVFVGELPTTFYQKYSQGRHASGKLHDAYNNYRTYLASSGLISRRPKSKMPLRKQQIQEKVFGKDEIDKALHLLSTEVNIEKCISAWKKTFSHRQELLKGDISTLVYIRQYPLLEQPEGYKLYLIDTEHIATKDMVLEIPDIFLPQILDHTKKNRSVSVSNILGLITEEPNETNKPILALMLLPFLFPSPLKRGRNGLVKLTKAECADTFICHFPDLKTADRGLPNLLKQSTELQPVIIFIGSPVTISWVIIGHIKYSFADLSSCLKCAISAYVALNIKYPSSSEKAWFFLQKYIFNISTSYDKYLEDSVKTFANDLNLIPK